MRQRLIPLLVCFILVGTAATVALAQVGTPSPARAAAVRATGSFEISNSGAGQPIFAASGLGPGGSVSGKVTIQDSGSVPVALKLQRGKLTDAAGIGGGVLSGSLQLTVADVTKTGSPRTIYSGPLDSMPEREAGQLQPGGSRTYQFTASLPDGSPSTQNAFQAASTSVAYSWVAEEASGEGEEAPQAEAPPATPGGAGGAAESRGTQVGGETGGGPAGAVAGVGAGLDLTVPRISRALSRGGAVLTYVDCDASCRILVRGKLRASAHGHHRTAKIRFSLRRPYAPGSKRMRIPIPRGMRDWLRRMPPPKRLKARLTFIATGTAGGRDVVKKKVRLRVRHHR
jgi:spore coat-associated protein N